MDFMMRFELGFEQPDPRPRPQQRRHHRTFLRRRRHGPPRPLHVRPRRLHRTDLLSRLHSLRALHLRLRKRQVHRHRPPSAAPCKPPSSAVWPPPLRSAWRSSLVDGCQVSARRYTGLDMRRARNILHPPGVPEYGEANMFCTECGCELRSDDSYCSRCGLRTAAAGAAEPAPHAAAYADKRDKKIAGVCAGFARYMDTDVTLMRIIWLVPSLRCRRGLHRLHRGLDHHAERSRR